MSRARVSAWLVLGGLVLAGAAEAGQSVSSGRPAAGTGSALTQDLPFAFDGPPPPVPPAVITRDESGRATVRAGRLTSPIRLDGRLDEAVYTSVPPMSGFIQMEPQPGLPATQKTEVWVLFDGDHVYVTVRCWESHPERMVVNDMRRDGASVFRSEHVVFVFDTFYDRRNGLIFAVNAIGGRADGQLTNERQYNRDWNTSGMSRWAGSRGAGRPSSPSRSSHFGTGPGAPRFGASTWNV